MQRMISVLTLLLCLTLLPVAASAGWFSGDTLVTIDGTEYTTEDFKRWWEFWKEKDQPLPKAPGFYVDWLLLKGEAERMDIANTSEFRRQEIVFLQARGLMMMKNEAVDSQINVTEEQIKARYQEKYLPRWLVQQVTFADEGTASAAWQELSDEELTVAQLLDRSVEENGPISYGDRWLRPNVIDSGWTAILRKTQAGEVVDPELHKKGRDLFYVKDIDTGSEKDLAMFRKEISDTLWREQEDRLTEKLLGDLIERYQMEIDEERLAAFDLNADYSTLSDEPVITSNKENVSEKQFFVVVGKLKKTRPTTLMIMNDEEQAQNFKLEVARNIIHQSVTNWWAVDRHFEKEEPFKWLYQFNYNYRQVLMLENQLFSMKVEPTEEEIAQLYQDKAKYYTVPAQAKLYIIDQTQGPINKIWAEVAVGKPFTRAIREHLEQPMKPTEVPVNHLDKQIKSVTDKLAEGETSQIFEGQGGQVLVHLVSRTPQKTLPLETIKDSLISGYKRESYDRARETYLETLRASSRIELDEGNWKVIQKELGGA